MSIKIGINGMGRIGRTVLREIFNRGVGGELELVAVNNPGNKEQYLHLTQFDSVHGPFKSKIEATEKGFTVDGKEITFFSERDPAKIPWDSLGVQIVIDATGKFKDHESLSLHKRGTVQKVIMCAPGKNMDATIVMGINHETYNSSEHHIMSNASCTTNCLAPVCKVLHESFGIENGFMTTVHAYTSDQQLLDGSHKDLRRARAAAVSMVPTTTGAAKSVGLVIPELKGKLDGYAVRVPTPNVSMVDLTVNLSKAATKEQVNEAMIKAADSNLKGILKVECLPLVSQDYMGMRESSCVDLELTNVIDKTLKIVSWYDNEAGFSNRIIDLVTFVGAKL